MQADDYSLIGMEVIEVQRSGSHWLEAVLVSRGRISGYGQESAL